MATLTGSETAALWLVQARLLAHGQVEVVAGRAHGHGDALAFAVMREPDFERLYPPGGGEGGQ